MSIRRRNLLKGSALVAAMAMCGYPALAATAWGKRPVKLVVPFPPGGSSDLIGRLVAERLSAVLNVDFFVENKPGGTTQLGTELVANAKPDGQTWLLAASSTFTIMPQQREVSVTLDDFESAGSLAKYIAVMAVNKNSPVTNLDEFVEFAKERGDDGVTFGTAGNASVGHIYGTLLGRELGIKVIHAPYRGSAAAVNGLVGGEIDFVADGAITPMVLAGRARALATLSDAKHPKLPDVPTIQELGIELPFSKSSSWGLLAPKGTPEDITEKISDGLAEVLNDPEIKEALANANARPDYMSAKEFAEALIGDRDMYAKILPEIGISKS